MTYEFKFGDRVRWNADPRQFVYVMIDPYYDGNAGWIVSDDNAEYLASHTELELVPHRDTVRLDWFADNPSVAPLSENGMYCVVKVNPLSIIGLPVVASGLTMGEALDAAMQKGLYQ